MQKEWTGQADGKMGDGKEKGSGNNTLALRLRQ
jgi:hypothetical protein